jgi:hypothetical protein
MLAEVTAREIGRVTIAEALELTALVARKQPHRYGRFAARWVCLYLASLKLREGVPMTDLPAQLGHSKKSLTLDTDSHVLIDD